MVGVLVKSQRKRYKQCCIVGRPAARVAPTGNGRVALAFLGRQRVRLQGRERRKSAVNAGFLESSL